MVDDPKIEGELQGDRADETGDAVGGADASGAGNILAGVQPDEGEDETGEERRED